MNNALEIQNLCKSYDDFKLDSAIIGLMQYFAIPEQCCP